MWNWATRQSNVPGKACMAALCAFAALMLCALAPVRAGVNNWTSLGPEGGRIPRLAFGPAGSARVLALAGSTLYRSNDNGQTWEELFSQTSLFDFAAHPANPNIVFGLGSGNFLYASTDGGVTFTQRPSSTPRFRRIEFSRDGSI